MNILLNIIWVVFGGLMIAIEYALSSVVMMITIIGIPFGLQTINMKPMRKTNRQKNAKWALEVFDKSPYMTLSMTRPDYHCENHIDRANRRQKLTIATIH